MSEATKIEWANSTGNPWIGCTKVSLGCKNCYAETLDRQRFSKTMGGGTKEKPVPHWGPGAPRFLTKGFWKDALKWNRDFDVQLKGWRAAGELGIVKQELAKYGMLKPVRPRIFPSLCDWLDDEVPIEWLADFLKLIHDTPNLDWLLLTKRPEKFVERVERAQDWHFDHGDRNVAGRLQDWWRHGSAPSNVWLGVSVENQEYADKRIPALLTIPARLRFLSVEPLLGRVDLAYTCFNGADSFGKMPGIDWVIVGGESGAGARPCNVGWIGDVVMQCQAAGVPCFVKQFGASVIAHPNNDAWPVPSTWETRDGTTYFIPKHPKGGDPAEWPEDLRVRQFPAL